LYALLGLVLSTEQGVQEGASGHEEWDAMIRELSRAAYQQSAPESWHLPDGAFDAQTVEQQADPDDWQVGDLRVHRVSGRTAAVQAIRDVGEQGEGPTSEGELSHFGRFLGIYRGGGGMPECFPPQGSGCPPATYRPIRWPTRTSVRRARSGGRSWWTSGTRCCSASSSTTC
jgi:hypothetical protein